MPDDKEGQRLFDSDAGLQKALARFNLTRRFAKKGPARPDLEQWERIEPAEIAVLTMAAAVQDLTEAVRHLESALRDTGHEIHDKPRPAPE